MSYCIEKIEEIIGHLIANDNNWFKNQNILIGDKGDRWILNYGIGETNDYNRLVRGMVVQKPVAEWSGRLLDLIVSFPFTRFFNRHEGPAAEIDFSNAEMIEKLDGSMVGVYFPEGTLTPHWHTRKMVSSHSPDMNLTLNGFNGGVFNLMELIGEYVAQVSFSEEDLSKTYVFEFLHHATFVVTKYSEHQHGLYLLGGRDLKTHSELSEEELDNVAERIGVRRPRRWDSIADHEQILQLMKEISEDTPNFEGFVFRDRNSGERIKVKDPDYVQIHHMINDLRYVNLITKVVEGEEEEILAYFPQAKKRVDLIKEKMQKYLESVVEKVMEWQKKTYRGNDLALLMKGRPAKRWDKKTNRPLSAVKPVETDSWAASQILRLIEQPESVVRNSVEMDLRNIVLGHNCNPKKLIDIIGLHDID